MDYTIKKDGKLIIKRGEPKVFDIIINRKRVKYWFWKVIPTDDFEEIWLATDREIKKDTVEHNFLKRIVKTRWCGEDITVWDGEEYDGRITTFWYNNGVKGDTTLECKRLTDLYVGEWYIVDENGIPYIEREKEKLRLENMKKPILNEIKTKQFIKPNIEIKRGNITQINPTLDRGKKIIINPQINNNDLQQRPKIIVKRNF